MSGATFPRLTQWSTSADVTTASFLSELNDEFDNILDNLGAAGIDDYSTNTTQMRLQTDPGEVSSESLATSLAGELERIRFVIAEMKGETYWYTTADSSLSELVSALGGGLSPNRITSGRMRAASDQPLFLVPNGAALTVSLKGASTPFVYYINSTQYTISSNVTATSLVAAPSSSNTCAVNDTWAASGVDTKYFGEYGTAIPIDTVGSEITSLNGKIAAFSVGSTEYFLATVNTTSGRLENCRRGLFFDSADGTLPRLAFSDNATITLMKLTWVFAKTDGTLAVAYTNPRYSKDQPTSPAIGDYWYDLDNQTWKIFDSGSSWISASATLIGICVQDATNCVAARSFDFFKSFSDVNTVKLEKTSVTEIRALPGAVVNVYGNTLKWEKDSLRWNVATDFESGVTEAGTTLYFLYVTEDGDTQISNKTPHDRRGDLMGFYHPENPWRCVGQVWNNSGSDFTDPLDFQAKDPVVQIHTYVSSNNLNGDIIMPLSAKLSFRNTTAGTGSPEYVQAVPHRAFQVPSSATLGHTSAVASQIYFYLLRNSNFNIEPVVSTLKWDEGSIQSTTLLDSSATSKVLYSSPARTNVPIKLIGRAASTQGTAGTWATTLSEVTPFDAVQVINYAIATSSGTFTTTSMSYAAITNQSVSITTRGGPVLIMLMTAATARWGHDNTSAQFRFRRDSTTLTEVTFTLGGNIAVPPAQTYLDIVAAGTYTYDIYAKNGSGNTTWADGFRLFVMELPGVKGAA